MCNLSFQDYQFKSVSFLNALQSLLLKAHPEADCWGAARTSCSLKAKGRGACPVTPVRRQGRPEGGRRVHPRVQMTRQGHVDQVGLRSSQVDRSGSCPVRVTKGDTVRGIRHLPGDGQGMGLQVGLSWWAPWQGRAARRRRPALIRWCWGRELTALGG